MRLRSFEVKGFKNLRLPIRLEDLGPVNVVHGDNNVGKSNLLESIELYFDLLRRCVCDKPGHGLHPQERRQALDQRRARYPFDLRSPRPIDLRGVIAVNADEVARLGLEVTHPADAVEIAVRAVPADDLGAMTFGITAFRYGDGFDAASLPEDDPESVKAAQLLRVIARADGGKPEPTPTPSRTWTSGGRSTVATRRVTVSSPRCWSTGSTTRGSRSPSTLSGTSSRR